MARVKVNVEPYDMVKLAKQLGFSDETLFLTRPNGEMSYPLLVEQLLDIPERAALLLMFPPDQIIDSSFVDESIVRLGEKLLAGEFAERGLLLGNLSDSSVFNVEAVISIRELKLGFIAVEPTGEWQCIGHLEASLAETLDLVAEREQLTAAELAETLQLAVNTASNRLKRLYDRRLVWREHEITDTGLQYTYHFWKWA